MPPTRSHFPKSETARRIARLADRARRGRVPVVFVNDNLGRWRSDREALIQYCLELGGAGAKVVETLRPMKDDFFVLKSTLSGFHQTPLEAMLRQGKVKTTVITGFVTGNCVMFTAVEAYMRDFKVILPSDCVADQTQEEHSAALRKMRRVIKAKTPAASTLRLRR